MGRGEEAVKIDEALKAEYPDDSRLRQDLGVIYADLGRWDLAEENMRKAVELQPSPETWFNLASVLEQAGNLAEAVRYLRLYIEKTTEGETLRKANARKALADWQRRAEAAGGPVTDNRKTMEVQMKTKGHRPGDPARRRSRRARPERVRGEEGAGQVREVAQGRGPAPHPSRREGRVRKAQDGRGQGPVHRAVLGQEGPVAQLQGQRVPGRVDGAARARHQGLCGRRRAQGLALGYGQGLSVLRAPGPGPGRGDRGEARVHGRVPDGCPVRDLGLSADARPQPDRPVPDHFPELSVRVRARPGDPPEDPPGHGGLPQGRRLQPRPQGTADVQVRPGREFSRRAR